MTDKQFSRMSRRELLELLLEQIERADALEQELTQLKDQLNERSVAVTQAGSIAEASLRLSGVFDAAQVAADQYLENIKALQQKLEYQVTQNDEHIRAQAEAVYTEVDQKCRLREEQCEKKINELVERLYQKQPSV